LFFDFDIHQHAVNLIREIHEMLQTCPIYERGLSYGVRLEENNKFSFYSN